MIRIQNNSDTAIIVVHEIYGINNHIAGVCNRLGEEKYDVLCPNLLAPRQNPFSYREEPIAYQNFMKNVGFSLAQQRIEILARSIRDKYRYCFIVGYSIGATIAWMCSRSADWCTGAVGIYGSRIRDYQDVEPQCPVFLCFPRMEEGFDVDCLIQALSAKKNVNLVKANGLHGFADPWSGKYCEAAAEDLFGRMIEFIEAQKHRQI